MFGLLRSRSPASEKPSAAIVPTIASDGIRYSSPAPTAAEWLAMPLRHADADLGCRLAQIYLEGFGEPQQTEFLLGWSDLYALLAHPEFCSYREALLIPPASSARPRITSRGALMDADFTILLDGWCDVAGRPLQSAKLTGRVLQVGAERGLLTPEVHGLLAELERFHATSAQERTKTFKEQAFGRIRRLAVTAGCQVGDYVARTVVLTPERVRLSMEKRSAGSTPLVEVVPSFDEAPERWLSQFDRLPLQDSYDVPDGASLVRVVLSPDVKSVFAEIKRMPGRLMAGDRAEAFLRNPFAVLGEQAHAVLDADDFDKARQAAGIHFQQFTPQVERGGRGEVLRVGLEIHSLDATVSDTDSETAWFADLSDLRKFNDELDRRLQCEAQSIPWRGRDLELVGDSLIHHAQLVSLAREWGSPSLWTASELFDLSNYSERIAEIGVETPFITPVIVKKDESGGWFESNAQAGLVVKGPSDTGRTVPVQFSEVPSLREAVVQAQIKGEADVLLPGLEVPVPLRDAELAVRALERAQQELKQEQFRPPGSTPTAVREQKRLILKRNVEEIEYTEQRADVLTLPEGSRPRLPDSLRRSVELKPHQETGVAWLQHLWDASPQRCRGTVLADDMGLGKTLQLLCFIARCFEEDNSLPPALVVAPVALLDNWCNEIARFFEPGALPVLTLYGAALKSLRASRSDLDQALRDEGVTRLLKKGWVGDARLVLTTYETMRDLEFSMASQPWSIMVCDEAQKIKTPAAMVTRSAKKQKVRFRIACTGTPVENTLADLWCLFDFVQPGMLGALNHFSRTYRQPIEARTEEQKTRVEELRATIRPQILHRRKSEVAKDLPPLTEVLACKRLPMSAYQDRLYARALTTLKEQRQTNPSAQLQALLAIRKICSDPHGFGEPETRNLPIDRVLNESPKMGWLIETLKKLAADAGAGHKVIVFCEFRELQLLLQRVIAAFFGFAPSIVNGDTSADPRAAVNRQALIDTFQATPGFHVIILSPVAVGFGVNIQAANHVIHFTRTWNPAKEDQATARAYRIGQTRAVQVYYPGVVSDAHPSFDVRLDGLLSRKRTLASDMLNGCSDITAADFADFGE